MATARFAKGTILQYETAPASATYVQVPLCSNIQGPDRQVNTIDVFNHDSPSNFSEFISGKQDPGQIRADVFYDPADTVHDQLLADLQAGTVREWQLLIPVGGGVYHGFEADGFVVQFGTQNAADAASQGNFAIQLTGSITKIGPVSP